MLVLRRAYSRAAAKAKGRRFQQQTVEVIKAEFPFLTGNDVRSTPMGCPGVDIILSPKAQTALPYEFELKCCESLSIWSVIEQSLKRLDVTSGMVPCIVAGKNRTKPLAVVPLGHWLNLVLAVDKHFSSLPCFYNCSKVQPRLNQFPNMATLEELENLYLFQSSTSTSTSTSSSTSPSPSPSTSTSTSPSLDETYKLRHAQQANESTSATINEATKPETKLLRCVEVALGEIDSGTLAVVRENLILFRNWRLSAMCSSRLNIWKIFPVLQNWWLEENKNSKKNPKTSAKNPTTKFPNKKKNIAKTKPASDLLQSVLGEVNTDVHNININNVNINIEHLNNNDRNAVLVLGRHHNDAVFVVLSFRVFLDLVVENNFGEHRLS